MSIVNNHASVVGETWARRFSNPVGSSDFARQIVLDSVGNVIVAGSTAGFISGYDALVLKYSNEGVLLWANRFNSTNNSTDQITGLAVDSLDNVFVVGDTYNNADNDLLVLAYSSSGTPLWTNRFDGLTHSNDNAVAVATDTNGDVYVAGYTEKSVGSVTDYDYVTIKYSRLGVPLWTNYYDSPITGIDQPIALQVGFGKVFVTGYSGSEMVTLAYSLAGLPLWTNHFHGTLNGGDAANAIALDSTGNVFVVGSVLLALSGNGVPLWTNYFGGGGTSLALDTSGHVFVALSASPNDFRTIAYNSAGVPLWTNRLGAGIPWAIAVDNAGKVFVTGYSSITFGNNKFATVAYSTAGTPLWTNSYKGLLNSADQAYAIAVDVHGDVFVTGLVNTGFGSDFGTFKYSNTGTPVWTNLFNYPGNRDDIPSAMCLGPDQRIYVAGASQGVSDTTLSMDYLVLAHSPDGSLLWSNRYNGPGNINDYPTGIGVSTNGMVVVTGSAGIASIGNTFDYLTIAYAKTGQPLWTNSFNGGANGADQATALVVAADGTVYITGSSETSTITSESEYVTIAYSSAGIPLWTNRYRGSPSSKDQATAMTLDHAGNVLVTGTGFATLAYSPSGIPLWTNRYTSSSLNKAAAIAVDGNGQILVTGVSSAVSYDYVTIKYSNTGTPLWTNRYDGLSGGTDSATAVAVDSTGNVFVTGRSTGSGIDYDYATVAYSSNGTLRWVRRFHGQSIYNDAIASAIAVTSTGNVIVTGSSPGISNLDIVTIAYSNDGNVLWTNSYNGPANGDDTTTGASCLAIGNDDSIYVAGASDGDFEGSTMMDFVTIKYSISPRLNIARSSSLAEISWPPSFLGVQLQTRPDLSPSASWTTVPFSTTTNRMLFPATSGAAFFRTFNP